MEDRYAVYRHWKSGNVRRKKIASGLTLQEARRHCSRHDTHKKNAKGEVVWFDGFTKE